jgi:enediyne biosynthesis protein E4
MPSAGLGPGMVLIFSIIASHSGQNINSAYMTNRNGVGATVRVQSGDHLYSKQNGAKSDYLSQSVLPLYFGLGDTPKVDRVEIAWPSGRRQVITNVQPNQILSVTEPK